MRQGSLDAIHGPDDVGARQFENRQQDRLLAVGKGRETGIFRRVYRAADVADPHRSAVLVGDDNVVPGRGVEHLAVIVNRKSAGLPVDGSLWAHRGRVDDHPAQILERHAEGSDLRGIDLDAHGRLLLPADLHIGDTRDLADVLVKDILGVIVDLGHRHRVRGQSEHKDRRVRRVDLSVGRRGRKVLWQLPARRIDRGLYVLRRAIDVAQQIELHCD